MMAGGRAMSRFFFFERDFGGSRGNMGGGKSCWHPTFHVMEVTYFDTKQMGC